MSNKASKPSYLPNQLVDKMEKEKGITFNTYSKEDAVNYLTNKNNYLRTASYRKNYKKHSKGKNKGKYMNLDFGYLVELSIIDTRFRYIVNEMCLDVEHFLKLLTLNEIDNNKNVDAYDVVNNFLSTHSKILSNIAILANSPFVNDLVHKYFTLSAIGTLPNENTRYNVVDYSDCPIWVLLELLTFGEFITFYKYYFSLYPSKQAINTPILNVVKSLRNGTSHNNCILSNLNRTSHTKPPLPVSRFVGSVKTISSYQRRKKLSSRTIFEFSTLLYVYNLIIPDNIKSKRAEDLHNLFNIRMQKNKIYFTDNDLILSTYDFLRKLIKYYFDK